MEKDDIVKKYAELCSDVTQQTDRFPVIRRVIDNLIEKIKETCNLSIIEAKAIVECEYVELVNELRGLDGLEYFLDGVLSSYMAMDRYPVKQLEDWDAMIKLLRKVVRTSSGAITHVSDLVLRDIHHIDTEKTIPPWVPDGFNPKPPHR